MKIERSSIIKKYYSILKNIKSTMIDARINIRASPFEIDTIINEEMWNIYPHKETCERYVNAIRKIYRHSNKLLDIKKIHSTEEYKNYIDIKTKFLLCVDKQKSFKENKHQPPTKTVTYIQGCPVEGCKGLINKEKYKCSLCSKRICSKCRVSLKSKEEIKTHKCNKEDLKTVKLLKTDTKACPKCATNIYKISGCNQIYCVVCHIAFDWKTGRIETGTIHNPHYFEYLRNRGLSVHDNIECGDDVPHISSYYSRMTTPLLTLAKHKNHMRKKHIDIYTDILSHVHNLVTDTLQNLINQLNTQNNELSYDKRTINYKLYALRIKYIKNELSEKVWSKKVYKYYDDREKNNFYIEIYNSLRMILTESIKKLYNDLGEPIKTMSNLKKYDGYVDERNSIIKTFLDYTEDVRKYFNETIIKERSLYGNYKSYNVIGPLYEIMSHSDVEKGLLRPYYYGSTKVMPEPTFNIAGRGTERQLLYRNIPDRQLRVVADEQDMNNHPEVIVIEDTLEEILMEYIHITEEHNPQNEVLEEEEILEEKEIEEEILEDEELEEEEEEEILEEEDGESESECILVEDP